MDLLDLSDVHRLNAVAGWLELGNAAEALAEFEKISPAVRKHPAALEMEWMIRAQTKDWPAALEVARRLRRSNPDSASSWIHHSFCLHEMKETERARAELLRAVEKFPNVVTIPYNLACYACQLGNEQEARTWLDQAIRLKGKKKIKAMALEDPDLKPLWKVIQKL
jgi:tetratricopeptide (TPR) repeat protein